jgi:hypothetical protein
MGIIIRKPLKRHAKQARYPAANGVVFIAYEIREGHWAVSRETDDGEQFLRIYPTHEAARTLAINEGGAYQSGLLFDEADEPLEVEGFDCFQHVDCLPGQRGLFEGGGA